MKKALKDVINGELQFGISCVPNGANIPLNEDMNLEIFELCSARVLVQPYVQHYSHKQSLSIRHDF